MSISDTLGLDISDKEAADKMAAKAYSNQHKSEKEDVGVCKLLCKSPEPEAREYAVTALRELSQEYPEAVAELDETLWKLCSDEESTDITKTESKLALIKLKQEDDIDIKLCDYNALTNKKEDVTDTESLVRNAASITVSKDRLTGTARYFPNVKKALYSGEQPHFIYALSQGTIIPDWSYAVDKLGKTTTVIKGDKDGALVITDRGMRIVWDSGKTSERYGSITHTKVGNYPSVELHTGDKNHRLRLARSLHSVEDVSEGADFINKIRNNI